MHQQAHVRDVGTSINIVHFCRMMCFEFNKSYCKCLLPTLGLFQISILFHHPHVTIDCSTLIFQWSPGLLCHVPHLQYPGASWAKIWSMGWDKAFIWTPPMVAGHICVTCLDEINMLRLFNNAEHYTCKHWLLYIICVRLAKWRWMMCIRKTHSLPFYGELAHKLLPPVCNHVVYLHFDWWLVRMFTAAAHSYELRAFSIWSSINKTHQETVVLGKIFKRIYIPLNFKSYLVP